MIDPKFYKVLKKSVSKPVTVLKDDEHNLITFQIMQGGDVPAYKRSLHVSVNPPALTPTPAYTCSIMVMEKAINRFGTKYNPENPFVKSAIAELRVAISRIEDMD